MQHGSSLTDLHEPPRRGLDGPDGSAGGASFLTAGALGVDGGSSFTVYRRPSRRYRRSISARLNGREPSRLKTASWLPFSSTARSRSRPFEMASAGPFVFEVAISFGCSWGAKPRYVGVPSGDVSCTT